MDRRSIQWICLVGTINKKIRHVGLFGALASFAKIEKPCQRTLPGFVTEELDEQPLAKDFIA